MNDSTVSMLALFSVLGGGMLVGRISVWGITLGTSGVIFVALAAGHYGYKIPAMAGDVGVVLFVYCLGIGAGPSFLRMFLRHGKSLALMAVVMILSAAVAAWLIAFALKLSPDLTAGLFAGSLTSTPALAAAVERLPPTSDVAVGFGVAYPFGVIGVILFVQLVPRFIRRPEIANAAEASGDHEEEPIIRLLVEVANPGVAGKRLVDVGVISHSNCQVSRILVDNVLKPVPADLTLQLGQKLMLVGKKQRLHDVIAVLGKPCEDVNYVLDVEHQRRRVVVTSKEVVGHSLEQLHLRSRYGVTISRIVRQDVEFVPNPREKIQFGDALTAIGESEALDRVTIFAGHRERTLEETDFMSLCVGLLLGVLAGRVQLMFGGESISLGLAGGPLLVGLLLGHFGQIGPLLGRMPRAARNLLGDIGLALFLARAGSSAGENLIPVVRSHGLVLCLAAVVVVLVPMVVGLFLARVFLKIGLLESLGGICGAMTCTPGLGAVTSAFDSSKPATSYATVYPLALILVTLLTPILMACV